MHLGNMTDYYNPTAYYSTTPYYDYSGEMSTVTDDFDEDLEETMCDKRWVREFRGYYEPALYWVIFGLGLVGNLLVVWIYTTVHNRLKTMTDMYLLNLAVADLLFLGTLPFWAIDARSGWLFPEGLCKMMSALYKINFFASMLLLTCISADRYTAIVRVTEAHNQSKRIRLLQSKLACLMVWLASCILALPEFIFAKVKTKAEKDSCTMVYWSNENNQKKIVVLLLQICMGFCLPLLVMVCCYSIIIRKLLQARSFEKHKALRVIFAVVAVFVVSQLPYNAHLMVEASQASNATMRDCNEVISFDVIGQVVKSLAYTHCCINPFLYAFIGVRFRKDLLGLLHKVLGRPLKGPMFPPKRPSVMSDTDTTPALSL